MKKYLLIISVLIVVLYLLTRKTKYYKYFQSIGFGSVLLDSFTNKELKDSYNYLTYYQQKGIPLTENNNPSLYESIVKINNKFHIFTSI